MRDFSRKLTEKADSCDERDAGESYVHVTFDPGSTRKQPGNADAQRPNYITTLSPQSPRPISGLRKTTTKAIMADTTQSHSHTKSIPQCSHRWQPNSRHSFYHKLTLLFLCSFFTQNYALQQNPQSLASRQPDSAFSQVELHIVTWSNPHNLNSEGRCCDDDAFSPKHHCVRPCRDQFTMCLLPRSSARYGPTATSRPINHCKDMVEQRLVQTTFPVTGGKDSPAPSIVIDNSLGMKDGFDVIVEWQHLLENSHGSKRMREILSKRVPFSSNWLASSKITHHNETAPLVYQARSAGTDHFLKFTLSNRCTRDHYTATCNRYCRAHDDQLHGHYLCAPETGLKICRRGWQRAEDELSGSGHGSCTKPICDRACSASGRGICAGPGQCQCKVGWKGKHCDQCKTSRFCQHGTCQRPGHCQCRPGWAGVFCNQDLQFCQRYQPCQNDGTCKNDLKGGFTCTCRPTFTGQHCDKSLHPTSACPSCLNGGTCAGGDSVCQCPRGFSGKRCQTRVESMACKRFQKKNGYSPCANMGVCIGRSKRNSTHPFPFICECRNGFTSYDCRVNGNRCGIYGPSKSDCSSVHINSYQTICKSGKCVPTDKRATPATAGPLVVPLITDDPTDPNPSRSHIDVALISIVLLFVAIILVIVTIIACKMRRQESRVYREPPSTREAQKIVVDRYETAPPPYRASSGDGVERKQEARKTARPVPTILEKLAPPAAGSLQPSRSFTSTDLTDVGSLTSSETTPLKGAGCRRFSELDEIRHLR